VSLEAVEVDEAADHEAVARGDFAAGAGHSAKGDVKRRSGQPRARGASGGPRENFEAGGRLTSPFEPARRAFGGGFGASVAGECDERNPG
jgi:hypothetical protein